MPSGILGIAMSGLNAAMLGIRTSQHNVANANTAGFHRHEVGYSSAPPQYSGSGYLGSGVEVSTIRRLYDQFIDTEVRTYQAQLSGSEAYASYATQVDSLLGNADTGLATVMQGFFAGVNEVANDPTSLAARQQMLSAGETLARRFNLLAGRLQEMRSSINGEVAAMVGQINQFSERIAKLNVQIGQNAGSGQPPNDLLDQRDQLVVELSKLVNVSQVQQSDGSVVVSIANGQALVVGAVTQTLQAIADPTDPTLTTLGLELADGSVMQIDEGAISGGRLGGLFGFRQDILLPASADLDQMAVTLSTEFNALHVQGFDLAGNTNISFFSATSALSIDVLVDDPAAIAAAGDTLTGIFAGPGDNANALRLAALQTAAIMGGGTATLAEYNSQLVSRNATLAHAADIDVRSYTALHRQAFDYQQSTSGVNLDEEAVNLVQFQQAYQAAARVIQVSTQLFDEILGIFG